LAESVPHTHVVRRLYRPDLPLFRDHLVRLDSDTRYNRFGLHVSDEYLGNYAELCFAPGSITYGYFEDGLIRGASELRMFASKEQAYQKDAEAAFSVEKPWRRRGIGADLMSHIVLAARNRSIGKLTIFCLRQNQAMLRLAKKFEAELKFEMSDVTGRLEAQPPSAWSLWHEFIDNTLDLGSALIDYQGRVIATAKHKVGLAS
jgi:GNAT superfamily N-acetyltransferase